MSLVSKIFHSILNLFYLLIPIIISYLLFILIILFLTNLDLNNVFLIIFNFGLKSILSIAIIYIGIIFSFIFFGISKYTRFIIYIGLTFLIASLFMIEISIIKSFSLNLYNFGLIKCNQPKKIYDFISCFLIGYMPSQSSNDLLSLFIMYGFWIYGFVFPIIILSYLFIDGMETFDIIKNEKYKKIIAICLSFLAYRGFIITKLIEFIYIGFFGVIIVLINFFTIKEVANKINILFIRFQAMEVKDLNKQKIEKTKRILKTKLMLMKRLPVNMMSVFFTNLDFDLKTVLQYEGKIQIYNDLINDFILAKNQNNRNGMIAAINKMIAAIS